MADVALRVQGLDEFRAALREADRSLGRELGKANKELGEDIVAKADAVAAGLGGVAAHSAAAGLKASARQNAATIILDAGRSPAVFGAEFGGRGRPTTQQFQPFRGSGDTAGYFLFPTIRTEADEGHIEERYGRLIDRLMARAFPD